MFCYYYYYYFEMIRLDNNIVFFDTLLLQLADIYCYDQYDNMG
jgi:hypothetical protein